MPRKAAAPAKTQTLERFDPDEDFSDVDGDLRAEFALNEETEDAGRHYVWVHNSEESIGEYKGNVLKYKIEHFDEGAVQPRMAAELKKGEAITRRDHVLMSCDRLLWEKRERFERLKSKKLRDSFLKRAESGTTTVDSRGEWRTNQAEI